MGSVYNMYGFSQPGLAGVGVSQVGVQTGYGDISNVGVATTTYPASSYGAAGPVSPWASFSTVTGQIPAASFPSPSLAPISYVGYGTGAMGLGSSASGYMSTFGTSLMGINAKIDNLMNQMGGGGAQSLNPLGGAFGSSGTGSGTGSGTSSIPGFGSSGSSGGIGTTSVDQGGAIDQAVLTDLIRKKQMMLETYSNIFKSLHDGLMTPIRNIRG